MNARLVVLLFVWLVAFEAAACPGCTYERIIRPDWQIKFLVVQTLVALVVVANRMDVVRFLYAFIPYVVLSYQALIWLFLQTSMASSSDALPKSLGILAGWGWSLNLVGVGLLFLLSRTRFFRKDREKGLKVWQPLAYCAAAFLANFLLFY